jgi:hypothetical protein
MWKIIKNLLIKMVELTYVGVIIGAIMRRDLDLDLLTRRGVAAMLLMTIAALAIHYFTNNKKSKKS